MFETLKGVITEFLKGIFILKTNCLTTKYKSLNSISLFNIQFLMLLKGIFFDKKYGLALDGEPWVIQKSNKVIGTCILSFKIKET